MPVQITYPGVYVQEGVSMMTPAISGTPTAVTAFVDVFERGPVNVPTMVTSLGAFAAQFGGPHHGSRASYGIHQFFRNGGEAAWVVRVAGPNDTHATRTFANFTLEANGPGEWGNDLQAAVQPAATAGLFDLVVRDVAPPTATNPNAVVERPEVYRDLSLDREDPKFIGDVLRDRSALARMQPGSLRPPTQEATAQVVAISDSIINLNNVMNAADDRYGPFSGGSAQLVVETAGTLGISNDADPTGLFMLERVAAEFDLVCLPAMAGLAINEWHLAFDTAVSFCEKHNLFLIVDPPASVLTGSDASTQAGEIARWFEGADPVRGSTSHAALYFPRIVIADPAEGASAAPFETETSGTLAGIYARTDARTGVWKAPAGRNARLDGVLEPAVHLTNQMTGELNRLGICCVPTFPGLGTVSWGARTLVGSGSDWTYVSTRRLGSYVERSIRQGLGWVVFEPNDEALWARLRLDIGSFFHKLYQTGAFPGSKPSDAYYVKCGPDTTTQADIDRGIVNIEIGFAPLHPAEFVVVVITEQTGSSGP